MSSNKKQVPGGLKGAEIDLEDGMLRDEGGQLGSEGAVNRGDDDLLPDPKRGDLPPPSANDTKRAPILLKNPPVQAMNGAASGHLPTFKDQARSITATATAASSANTTRATHQSTENAANGHLPTFKDQARSMAATASASSSRASSNTHQPSAQEDLKDGGPDFKDQVRSGRPPQQQRQQQQRKSLPSAQGVPVDSVDQEPQATTVVAFVLETMEGDNENPVVHTQQYQENREPPANDGPTRARKRLFWAAGILLVVVAVVVGVVVALVAESPEEEEPPMVFAEETKLTASEGAGGDSFGFHVAIDEDTVVVGTYQYLHGDNAGGTRNNGTAFVFTRTGNTWTEQAKLVAGDGAADDYFGSSVGISGDTIVVGAHLDDDKGLNSGSAYVYKRTGTTWTEQAKLTASDGDARDQFGFSVAIEGDTIVVGAWRDDDNGSDSGTAFVFTRMGTAWTEQAKLTASDGAAVDDQFGRSVAIASNTIVVGATPESGMNGSAFVFTRTGTTWTEQDRLTSTSAPDFFGVHVAIAGDTIVVGADREDDNGTNSGTVFVYTRTGTVWTQQAKLKASDAAGDDRFGVSVAIAGDTIVVGADWDDENATNSGSVYVFMRMEGEWTQQAKLTASEGGDVEDQFGISVGIASGTIVVGAWQDDNDNGVDSGSAYVYDII